MYIFLRRALISALDGDYWRLLTVIISLDCLGGTAAPGSAYSNYSDEMNAASLTPTLSETGSRMSPVMFFLEAVISPFGVLSLSSKNMQFFDSLALYDVTRSNSRCLLFMMPPLPRL